MKLDDNQRQAVTKWIADGAKLSEVQNRLAAEFGVKLTYMEARFLMDDLKLTPKDPERPKVVTPPPVAAPVAKPPAAAPAPAGEMPVADEVLPARNVVVSVDQITRPGSLISGKVNFSDGQVADWYLDQTGRLGLVPKQQGYKPSAGDVQDFQLALQQEITKLGYA